jgi:hypothetical protein
VQFDETVDQGSIKSRTTTLEVRASQLQSCTAFEGEGDSMVPCLKPLLEDGCHLLLVFDDQDLQTNG